MTTTSTPLSAPEHRLAVDGVSWEVYRQLCDQIVHGATRINYDQGRMEIVVVSNRHERYKTLIARILEQYADIQGITVEGLGNTTCQREDLQKALEPDECYWITNAAAVVGREEELDLTIDPPPDLAIEVDISRSSVPRQPIYAAMGVPELWRFDGRELQFLRLSSEGMYVPSTTSLAFPSLSPQLINEVVAVGTAKGQSAAAAELRRRLQH